MTCIAWDGKTLAADKMAIANGLTSTVTKIFRIGNLLVGTSGELDQGCEMVEWVRNGRKQSEFPASQRTDKWAPTVVIEADGRPSRYEQSPHPIRQEQPCYAMGSGIEIARAVMHLGHSSMEAVVVACALRSDCGNGVDTLTWEA